ncbi:unnamed protein product, partial [Owenia fusiformis]
AKDVMSIDCDIARSVAETFLLTGSIMKTVLFKKASHFQIFNREENKWLSRMEANDNLHIFRNIHCKLEPSFAWVVGKRYPSYLWQLANLVQLSAMPSYKTFTCKKCNSSCNCIIFHFLHCNQFLSERDAFFERLIDILPVQDSVMLFNFDDDIFLQTVLGSRIDFDVANDTIYEMFVIECANTFYNINMYFK